jgi:hypothetical protein
MKRLQTASIVILILISPLLAASNEIESDLILFKKEFENKIYEKIRTDQALKSILPTSFEILVIPVCYVESNQSNKKFNFYRQLKIDSSQSFAILKDRENRVLGFVYNFFTLSYSNQNLLKDSDQLDYNVVDLVYSNYSHNPFMLSTSKMETNRVIGFFDKKNIKFINREKKLINNPEDIIIQQNGSMEKFLETLEFERKKNDLVRSLTTIEKAKNVIKHDYISYSLAFKNDTTKILELFINEVAMSTEITSDQKRILKSLILNSDLNIIPFNGLGIHFLDKDISFLIRSVLTKKQYWKFVEYDELRSWMVSQASNMIYNYLVKKNGVSTPANPIDVRKYVFGQ